MNHWNGRTERSNTRKAICVALLESFPLELKRERRTKEERWKVRMRAREER